MEYSVEEVSPVQKKISVTLSPEDVAKSLDKSVSAYRRSIRLDGFRKGKVPAAMVEKRFHDEIYDEARQELITANINEITEKLDLTPVSGIKFEGVSEPLSRGKDYAYSMEFEVMPAFELPDYRGLSVEQDKFVPNDGEINLILQHIQKDYAKIVPVEGNEPAKEGQIANIDFEAFENGQPMPGIKTENYDLELGDNVALPDFEALVKTIAPGEAKNADIAFPEDFIVPEMAGKTLDIHIKVNSVKEAQLPPLDDELAKKLNMESLAKLEEDVRKSYKQNREKINRGKAQRKLLDHLLKQTDFTVPPAMIEVESRFLLADLAGRLEQQGRTLKSLGKSMDDLRKEMAPQAEAMARDMVLLQAIAKKENLSVSEPEISLQLLSHSIKTHQDFQTLRAEYEKTGLLQELKQRLLADKAMELIYNNADVKYIDEPPSAETPAEGN